MRNDKILTDKEKRFLFLSAKDNLTLSEKLEVVRFEKEQNHQAFKDTRNYAFKTACLTGMVLAMAFMPSFVLPLVASLVCLGNLVYMESTSFRKVQAKLDYYINALKMQTSDGGRDEIFLTQNCKEVFNYSKGVLWRKKSAEKYIEQLKRNDLKHKNGLAYDLLEEYRSLPLLRAGILVASGTFLLAGCFLPQMSFLTLIASMQGISSLLALLDAKVIKTEMHSCLLKKEQQLEEALDKSSHQIESVQIKEQIRDQERELKKVAHQEKGKQPVSERQRDC